MDVRREQMRAQQHQKRKGIENAVTRVGIEEAARRIEVAMPGGKPGDIELRVRRPIDVTGAATDTRLPGNPAQHLRGAEGNIAQHHHVGLVPAGRLRPEDLAGPVELRIAQIGAQRQQAAAPGDGTDSERGQAGCKRPPPPLAWRDLRCRISLSSETRLADVATATAHATGYSYTSVQITNSVIRSLRLAFCLTGQSFPACRDLAREFDAKGTLISLT